MMADTGKNMRFLEMLPLRVLLWYENRLLQEYDRTLKLVTGDCESMLSLMSRKKLEYSFKRGLHTPAYVDFLKKHGIAPNPLPADKIVSIVPVTDKENYIKAYSYEQRCIDGKFPEAGNIDESSGSSGKPTNWVRSYREELLLLKAAYFEYKYVFNPKKQVIMISAWSTGPWATGVKFCELAEHFSLVKNTGTDRDDIIQTMKTFGKGYHYIIAGYPLFLQTLFEMDFNWKDYDIDLLTGGDGYSAVWPSKISHKLKHDAKVVSSYGCSDIDIGIGFETPFAQTIRHEAAHNRSLSAALFGGLQTTPMLFQYNPALHNIQNLPGGEFAITHLDPDTASPKIKYNIHDTGGKIDFSAMIAILKEHAPRLLELMKDDTLHLPFLYIAGRSDGTLSFDGGNVYPEQLDIIFTKIFPDKVNHFKMLRAEKKKQPFQILVELRKGIKKTKMLTREIESAILEQLPKLNKDYAESLANNKNLVPIVELFNLNEGLFKENPAAIKYKFIEKSR